MKRKSPAERQGHGQKKCRRTRQHRYEETVSDYKETTFALFKESGKQKTCH